MIHIFSPLRTYSLPDFLARVRMPPGLEPKSGSVRPKQPSFSPFCMTGQPGLLLLVAAEGVDGIHHQRRLHADEGAHAAVAALQFLHHQAVFDVRHSGAAVALEAGAVEAEVGHRLDQFTGEAAGAVALLDDGDEVVFDELARGIADQALVVGEQGVEFEEINSPELDGHHGSRFCFFAARTGQAVREWKLLKVTKGNKPVKPVGALVVA